MRAGLLDERLEWPRHLWQHGGPWRLGHGLTVVGPGWWPLVRRGFAAVAEVPGAAVTEVRQKCALVEVHVSHPDRGVRVQLHALAAELTEASRSQCEACGRAVPTLPPKGGIWRNQCQACAAWYDVLAQADVLDAEYRLWEVHAGGVRWPRRVP